MDNRQTFLFRAQRTIGPKKKSSPIYLGPKNLLCNRINWVSRIEERRLIIKNNEEKNPKLLFVLFKCVISIIPRIYIFKYQIMWILLRWHYRQQLSHIRRLTHNHRLVKYMYMSMRRCDARISFFNTQKVRCSTRVVWKCRKKTEQFVTILHRDLAKQLQRRRFLKSTNQKQEWPVAVLFVN